MGGHHLILGQTIDFLSGSSIVDTHDERYRQKLARLLVIEKGYGKQEIQSQWELPLSVDSKRAIVRVDFAVTLDAKVGMIVKYGPGSIVSRHRPALAASRLLVPYQVPCVVVTNGEDADILEGASGSLISRGLEDIPVRSELIAGISLLCPAPIAPERLEMESRILYAFEVDDSCPCDDTVTRVCQ